MKKINKIALSSILLGCLVFVSFFLKAQNTSDLSKFLNTSQQGKDASKLIGAYASPVIKAVSYGMTGGWYHTGKTHSKLGVDLGVTINTVFTPTSDNYFNPASLGLSGTVDPNNGTTFFPGNTTHPGQGAPTFVGPKDQTTYTTSIDPDGSGPLPAYKASFSGPEGLDLKKSIGFSAIPVPMIQLGIGLFFNTDLKVRYLQYNRSGSKVNMLGFGLMHDIKQHIPGIKLLPFDLSLLAAYNSFTGSTDLKAGPNLNGIPESTDGKISYKLNSWVAQVVISKKVSVLTGYLGVGYGSVSTNVDVTGTFKIGTPPLQIPIKDPVSIKFAANKSLKLTAGIRLKLGPIYLVGDYTLQKYNSLTVGLGVSIR